ncbi:hypothetical protein [Neisseria montereyensis]|uniref:Uncharacterized protein n=1 Tax=Neisseria montereyensis TaxID=2973938 RepID=A0ABT2FAN4_9NEIS|nr:hypothetical protein [Neisseria montereyensis]MCS4533011.1 hypothetical protein [Neisseria montereyensis]
MENKSKIFNIVSIATILAILKNILSVFEDRGISFYDNFFILFIISILLSFLFLKNKKSILTAMLIITPILLLVGWIFILPEIIVIFFPILFLIPLGLSILSLKDKENTLAKILLVISLLLLVITGIFCMYVYLLGSNWRN